MSTTSRSRVLGFGLLGLILETVASHPSVATDQVSLFKVVTARDEIVIGLSGSELARFDSPDADGVTGALRRDGSVNAVRYVARRTGAGDFEQVPAGRVGLSAAETTRVEPYISPVKVVPLEEWR
jgi:hypothetical protein